MPADRPILYGAPYSVYVGAVRLALAAKGVSYDLVPVDVFADGGPPTDHLARHPFGRIPAFEVHGLTLYETAAIQRYIDEAFDGPALQPADAGGRARMVQIQSILDQYAYRPWVWDLYVERCERDAPDEARIAAAIDPAARALDAIEAVAAAASPAGPYLLGEGPCLADCTAGAMTALLERAEEGAALLDRRPFWTRWRAARDRLSDYAEIAAALG